MQNTMQDGKLCRNGKEFLQKYDAYPTVVHQDGGTCNRLELEGLARVKLTRGKFSSDSPANCDTVQKVRTTYRGSKDRTFGSHY